MTNINNLDTTAIENVIENTATNAMAHPTKTAIKAGAISAGLTAISTAAKAVPIGAGVAVGVKLATGKFHIGHIAAGAGVAVAAVAIGKGITTSVATGVALNKMRDFIDSLEADDDDEFDEFIDDEDEDNDDKIVDDEFIETSSAIFNNIDNIPVVDIEEEVVEEEEVEEIPDETEEPEEEPASDEE